MLLCISGSAYETLKDIPITNNKNKVLKPYISHSLYWQVVLRNMFICKLLYTTLPLTFTEFNAAAIMFWKLAVNTL